MVEPCISPILPRNTFPSLRKRLRRVPPQGGTGQRLLPQQKPQAKYTLFRILFALKRTWQTRITGWESHLTRSPLQAPRGSPLKEPTDPWVHSQLPPWALISLCSILRGGGHTRALSSSLSPENYTAWVCSPAHCGPEGADPGGSGHRLLLQLQPVMSLP